MTNGENGGFDMNGAGLLFGLILGGAFGGGGLFGNDNRGATCCNSCTGYSNEAVVAVNQANADAAARALMSDNINELGINNIQGQTALLKAMCDGFANVNNNITQTQQLVMQTTIDGLRSELTQCRANEAAQNVNATLIPYLASIQCCCNNLNTKISSATLTPTTAAAAANLASILGASTK